ncbi:hypothetical protein [Tianweitania sediminis]|uniref:Uncharacterized protein n=1 Tax=Tianweitania sediminis TaxID=1502156 RepID=A0A8J7R2Z2_9HYPH|nr:hypothetical protein [Tianweitania sediminis]MBP0440687.1 hypothetical protein [Tianweitania sediminis]
MSKTYTALPGVDWVNGAPVPENREIKLTAKEAMFDLAQGRIQLKEEAAEVVQEEQPVLPAPEPDATPEPRKRR